METGGHPGCGRSGARRYRPGDAHRRDIGAVKTLLSIWLTLLLSVTVDGSAATVREDVNADVAVVRGLRALSLVQLDSAYPINQALAYDFFVPCLDYADLATGNRAQQAIRRDVERDTRNAVIDVYGKLDYHAAYKGRDSLRTRSLKGHSSCCRRRSINSPRAGISAICVRRRRGSSASRWTSTRWRRPSKPSTERSPWTIRSSTCR